MKNYRQQGYVIETKDPRIEALADYYERAEQALRSKALSNKDRFLRLPGSNRLSPFSEQISSSDADAILDEAGLQNPLFNKEAH